MHTHCIDGEIIAIHISINKFGPSFAHSPSNPPALPHCQLSYLQESPDFTRTDLHYSSGNKLPVDAEGGEVSVNKHLS